MRLNFMREEFKSKYYINYILYNLFTWATFIKYHVHILIFLSVLFRLFFLNLDGFAIASALEDGVTASSVLDGINNVATSSSENEINNVATSSSENEINNVATSSSENVKKNENKLNSDFIVYCYVDAVLDAERHLYSCTCVCQDLQEYPMQSSQWGLRLNQPFILVGDQRLALSDDVTILSEKPPHFISYCTYDWFEKEPFKCVGHDYTVYKVRYYGEPGPKLGKPYIEVGDKILDVPSDLPYAFDPYFGIMLFIAWATWYLLELIDEY